MCQWARLVTEVFEQHPETLPGSDPVHVVAVGKAAAAMARAACEILGPRVASGVVIVPTDTEMCALGNLRAFHGGHPVPTDGSERGARAVAQLVNTLGVGDLLLCLISGGGSALMTFPPPGVSLRDVCETTDMLLRAGATIDELNGVRKHLDRLKGGRLAQAAAPARVLALILSDVLGSGRSSCQCRWVRSPDSGMVISTTRRACCPPTIGTPTTAPCSRTTVPGSDRNITLSTVAIAKPQFTKKCSRYVEARRCLMAHHSARSN